MYNVQLSVGSLSADLNLIGDWAFLTLGQLKASIVQISSGATESS